jgi:hypothetical protein
MKTIRDQYTHQELETILRIAQLTMGCRPAFRLAERKSGLSTTELVDLKRKIEGLLGIPTSPLVDYSKPPIRAATTNNINTGEEQ